MRIKIMLVDEPNGQVRIDCNPPLENLLNAYKGGDKTPALEYAIIGIGKMKGFSDEVQVERDKEERERALMNGIILPWKERKEQGPQEVN